MNALPRDLWRWRIAASDVADLSTEERLDDVGLPLPKPGRALWPAFQAVGEGLFDEGLAGLIAPSAARPASLVLCLFRADAALPSGASPKPPPEHHEFPPQVPTGMTT